MRVLMICLHLPYPPQSGALIRNYNLLKRVSQENEVWVASVADKRFDEDSIAHLKTFCAGVETVEFSQTGKFDKPLQIIEYLLKGWPVELRHYHLPELFDKIKDLVSRYDFDVIDIEDSNMGLYLEAIPETLHKKCVLTFHDVIYKKTERIFALETRWLRKLRMGLYSRMMARWEPFYTQKFGCCITVSEPDRQILLAKNPDLQIEIVNNGIDTRAFQPLPYDSMNHTLLFVGNMNYLPNIDAMELFCQQILPLVKKSIPDVRLTIVGLNPVPKVMALAGDGISIVKNAKDLVPHYQQSAVSVVPLRGGGGTRLKILESMAFGRPVVSTTIGCEGLEVRDEEHLFIADDAEKFAARIIQLLTDAETRERMVRNGRELVEKVYDWDMIAQKLLKVYANLAP